jgi:nucleoside-diphosphate-sugar epimerase
LIIGAAGMLGRKFAARVAADGVIGAAPVTRLTLVDAFAPVAPAGFEGDVVTHTLDLSVPGSAEVCVAGRPDVVMHLAAIVSGEAERDFDKGYRINLDGTRLLFEAIRAEHVRSHYMPRVVFSSSIAVFGAPFPAVIGDEFFTTPLTSYGVQKAIGELLLTDYSRHGFMDGIAIRLPTICIRPGTPNAAASGFFSNILREPLAGKEAVLPVDEGVRHWHASPRAAVGFLFGFFYFSLHISNHKDLLTAHMHFFQSFKVRFRIRFSFFHIIYAYIILNWDLHLFHHGFPG